MTPHSLPRCTLRRWPFWLAMVALVLAQGLALVHAVGHAPGNAVTASALDAEQGLSVLGAVTAHPDGSLACQVLDHLVQPVPWIASTLAHLTFEGAQAPLIAPRLSAAGGVASGYHARGPPVGA